jgi:hypothetical protein
MSNTPNEFHNELTHAGVEDPCQAVGGIGATVSVINGMLEFTATIDLIILKMVAGMRPVVKKSRTRSYSLFSEHHQGLFMSPDGIRLHAQHKSGCCNGGKLSATRTIFYGDHTGAWIDR